MSLVETIKQTTVCCLISFVSLTAFAVEFDSSLTATTQWWINTNDGSSQALNLTLLPEFQFDFDDGWRIKSIVRGRLEAISGMQIDDLNRHAYSQYSKPVQMYDAVELELRELYLQGNVGDIFIKLGKQQVVWGKADGLHVLDIVDPQSFREFILDKFESSRIPLWTVNIEWSLGDWDTQFLWIPDLTFHSLPKPQARFAFTSPELAPGAPAGVNVNLEPAKRPNNPLLDSDVGLRVATFWKGWDVTLNYLFQFNNLPVFRQRVSLAGNQPLVTIHPEYERTHVLGSTFSNAFSDWVIRGEIVYFSDHYFIARNPLSMQGVI